jgi:putative hemolysin
LSQLDKIPVAGDTITFKDLSFTVLTTRGLRITKVKVERVHTRATSSNAQLPGQAQAGQLLLSPGKQADNADVPPKTEPQSEPHPRYEIKEVER